MMQPFAPEPLRTMVSNSAITLGAMVLIASLCMPPPAKAALRHRGPAPDTVQPLAKPEPQFPVDANWTLAAVDGKPVSGDPPSFTLDDKYRATGFSGCNTYSMALFPMRGQKLGAGAIALTRKQCDKPVMLLERAFLVGLHSLPTWSIEGADLVIKGPTVTLRFRRGI